MRIRPVALLGIAATLAVGCSVDKAASTTSGSSAPSPTAITTEAGKEGVAMSKDELSGKADIPLYPGADVPEGQSSVTHQGSETRYELDMVTTDSPDKVADFFKSKMKVDKSAINGQIDMLGTTSKGKLADIKISSKDGKTTVKAVSLEESK